MVSSLLGRPPPNSIGSGGLVSLLRSRFSSSKPPVGVCRRVTKFASVMARDLIDVHYVGCEKTRHIFSSTVCWLSCSGDVSDHGCMSPGLRPPFLTCASWPILWLGPRGDCFGWASQPCAGPFGRQGINLPSNMFSPLSLLIAYLRLVYSYSSGDY